MGFGGSGGFGGAGGSKSFIRIKESDNSPDILKVKTIIVSTGSLTDNGDGVATISTGGGGGSGLNVISGSHGQILRFHSGSNSVIGEDNLSFRSNTGLQISGAIEHSGNISPANNLAHSIGASNNSYANVFSTNVITGDLHMKNERGDWTLVEERNSIVLRNNITGERFKMVMEKIED